MKLITLEKVLHVLKTGENEVHLSEALRTDSRKPLEKNAGAGKIECLFEKRDLPKGKRVL